MDFARDTRNQWLGACEKSAAVRMSIPDRLKPIGSTGFRRQVHRQAENARTSAMPFKSTAKTKRNHAVPAAGRNGRSLHARIPQWFRTKLPLSVAKHAITVPASNMILSLSSSRTI
jgi:hypothetical protein